MLEKIREGKLFPSAIQDFGIKVETKKSDDDEPNDWRE